VEHLPSKSDGRLGPDDVFVFYPPGGGGYGDPLDRDPELVRRDVLRGGVTREAALRSYGVRLTGEGAVDGEATGRERASRIEERLRGAPPAGPTDPGAPGEVVRRIAEYVVETLTDGRPVLRCRVCRRVLGLAGEEPRRLGLKRERPLAAAGPWLALPWHGESPHFVLVESICPSCGILFDVEQRLKASPQANA
jgi:N-methylhydantoinase B